MFVELIWIEFVSITKVKSKQPSCPNESVFPKKLVVPVLEPPNPLVEPLNANPESDVTQIL